MLKADRASSPRFADDDLEGWKVREVPAQIVAAKKPALSEVERALPRRSVVWGARPSRVLSRCLAATNFLC